MKHKNKLILILSLIFILTPQNPLLARKCKNISVESEILGFLNTQKGKFIRKEELEKKLGIASFDDVLVELDRKGLIVYFKGMVIIPRERIISQESEIEIRNILGDSGYINIPTKTIAEFRKELETIYDSLERIYRFTFGDNGYEEFFNYVFPQALLYYGDLLYKPFKILSELINSNRAYSLSSANLAQIWKDFNLTPTEPLDKEPLTVLKEILIRIKQALREEEFSENVVGFVIFGSYVGLYPHKGSDLDIRVITKTKPEKNELDSISNKLTEKLSDLSIAKIELYSGFSLDEKIRLPDFEEEPPNLFGLGGLLEREVYIIIAKESDSLMKIEDKKREFDLLK